MKSKFALFCLIFCFFALPATAQEWAREKVDESPRHLEWVTLEAEGRQLSTFVAYPENSQKTTAIVLIHEIFGHTDWFRLMADHLAAAGYVVVAPDLLSEMAPNGQGTDGFADRTAVRKGVSELPPDQVTNDLKAAVEYAQNIPATNGKVVVAGFCWGGSEAFRFATNSQEIDAAFVYYGTAPEAEQLKKIDVPIRGFYAENDARVNATLEETAKAMTQLGKDFEMEVYSGGGHGFMRAGEAPDASAENKSARAQAWTRTLKLLNSLTSLGEVVESPAQSVSEGDKIEVHWRWSASDSQMFTTPRKFESGGAMTAGNGPGFLSGSAIFQMLDGALESPPKEVWAVDVKVGERPAECPPSIEVTNESMEFYDNYTSRDEKGTVVLFLDLVRQ